MFVGILKTTEELTSPRWLVNSCRFGILRTRRRRMLPSILRRSLFPPSRFPSRFCDTHSQSFHFLVAHNAKVEWKQWKKAIPVPRAPLDSVPFLLNK